jgi:hypothetical protein
MPTANNSESTYVKEWTSAHSSVRWHKKFNSFTILGEGECIKTVFTIYAPGNPRPDSVDLDRWKKAL